MAKRSDQAPLESVRLLLRNSTVQLQPIEHQVSALPIEKDLEYYFVPAKHMAMFLPYHQPGQPFKNLKLINFDRPAIALNFFSKHKYRIERDVKPQQAQEILQVHRDILYSQVFLSVAQERELKHVDTLLRTVRQAPEQFRFCISNYHHYYKYWYCSFRYFEDQERTKTGTHNEHMLKYTERHYRNPSSPLLNERVNIIFVDTDYITKPVPYDNKEIDRELETYPDRIAFGLGALYIKSMEKTD